MIHQGEWCPTLYNKKKKKYKLHRYLGYCVILRHTPPNFFFTNSRWQGVIHYPHYVHSYKYLSMKKTNTTNELYSLKRHKYSITLIHMIITNEFIVIPILHYLEAVCTCLKIGSITSTKLIYTRNGMTVGYEWKLHLLLKWWLY